ncbi:MAG: pyruvate formate lyase activating enzyme [Candidatus Magnetoglobus multicellularis str. Araruama]|uniref:Pyruvate formate lyase activating enzyme n=1 Tax=Candidatus Magnetoglobus multicellularis str. Araruama TaxID=890399 RepID=A0A1V1P940_9BACT|nr:MAG: pyruvate formate lyase activating enzyme [Candidatus Magnetoglobus multicellularis str. Araruama]
MSRELLITDIQRFSTNDGPGFRTNVFIKGCSMKCRWCHNPETISMHRDLFWKKRHCIQCGECAAACPENAIQLPDGDFLDEPIHIVDREKCNRCMVCVDVCPSGAMEISGKPITIDNIIKEVESDMPFYTNSGGGMTISGGEPTTQNLTTADLINRAQAKGISVCLDTNGYCHWDTFQTVTRQADIVLFDLKHLDPAAHIKGTGVDNKLVLDNLKKLTKYHMHIWIRIPIIPDFNQDTDFFHKAADFLASLDSKIERIDLLPFHNWCEDKYGWLGKSWHYFETEAIHPNELEPALEILSNKGLNVTIGGSGFE